jgi:DNA-binding SARP family transcriptional activator
VTGDNGGTPHSVGCVHLLSSFSCQVRGREIPLGEGLRSLVIALALGERRIPRVVLIGRLWPDLEPEQGAKRLRQSLWRLRTRTKNTIVRADLNVVTLNEDACIDFTTARQMARWILAPRARAENLMEHSLERWHPLTLPLLPGAFDDETYQAQCQWDRLRLLALEKLAGIMLSQGETPAAMELASWAIGVDELSERPHRILAEAHLSHDDLAAARRVYGEYARSLGENMNAAPSPAFHQIFVRGEPRR